MIDNSNMNSNEKQSTTGYEELELDLVEVDDTPENSAENVIPLNGIHFQDDNINTESTEKSEVLPDSAYLVFDDESRYGYDGYDRHEDTILHFDDPVPTTESEFQKLEYVAPGQMIVKDDDIDVHNIRVIRPEDEEPVVAEPVAVEPVVEELELEEPELEELELEEEPEAEPEAEPEVEAEIEPEEEAEPTVELEMEEVEVEENPYDSIPELDESEIVEPSFEELDFEELIFHEKKNNVETAKQEPEQVEELEFMETDEPTENSATVENIETVENAEAVQESAQESVKEPEKQEAEEHKSEEQKVEQLEPEQAPAMEIKTSANSSNVSDQMIHEDEPFVVKKEDLEAPPKKDKRVIAMTIGAAILIIGSFFSFWGIRYDDYGFMSQGNLFGGYMCFGIIGKICVLASVVAVALVYFGKKKPALYVQALSLLAFIVQVVVIGIFGWNVFGVTVENSMVFPGIGSIICLIGLIITTISINKVQKDIDIEEQLELSTVVPATKKPEKAVNKDVQLDSSAARIYETSDSKSDSSKTVEVIENADVVDTDWDAEDSTYSKKQAKKAAKAAKISAQAHAKQAKIDQKNARIKAQEDAKAAKLKAIEDAKAAKLKAKEDARLAVEKAKEEARKIKNDNKEYKRQAQQEIKEARARAKKDEDAIRVAKEVKEWQRATRKAERRRERRR